MKPPSFDEFAELATQGNVIPIAESMLADLLTPVSAFLKFCGENEQGFLLESVEGGEQIARYSFLGRKPAEWISYDGQQVKDRAMRIQAQQNPLVAKLQIEVEQNSAHLRVHLSQ